MQSSTEAARFTIFTAIAWNGHELAHSNLQRVDPPPIPSLLFLPFLSFGTFTAQRGKNNVRKRAHYFRADGAA
jgi:hypothetical protein